LQTPAAFKVHCVRNATGTISTQADQAPNASCQPANISERTPVLFSRCNIRGTSYTQRRASGRAKWSSLWLKSGPYGAEISSDRYLNSRSTGPATPCTRSPHYRPSLGSALEWSLLRVHSTVFGARKISDAARSLDLEGFATACSIDRWRRAVRSLCPLLQEQQYSQAAAVHRGE
jgi:hypothetical protein